MAINKEIIIRVTIGIAFFGFVARVLAPLLFDKMKGKSLGLSKDQDFDYMVKRQQELLKSQYKISPNSKAQSVINQINPEMQKIKNELSWGGNEFQKDIKTKISKDFSYQFSDSKISSFLTLIERRNYLYFIETTDNKIDKDSIINFLSALFILFVLIDEIKNKELNFTENCAKKLNIKPIELALSLQIKILMSPKLTNIKPERIYVDHLVLHQFSDDTLRNAIDTIIHAEANLWKKSLSTFFEELSLFLNYASILSPIEKLNHKEDVENAAKILEVNVTDSIEDIKKKYKKMALVFHPDKIIPKKLPHPIEKKAIQKFNVIQESFEILSDRKAK
jgi:hypothetical protein